MDDGSKCTVHGRVCSECASREGCGVFWYDGIWGRFSGTEYRNYKIIGIYIIYIYLILIHVIVLLIPMKDPLIRHCVSCMFCLVCFQLEQFCPALGLSVLR